MVVGKSITWKLLEAHIVGGAWMPGTGIAMQKENPKI